MKKLFFYSLLFIFAQSYGQEMPKSSANDRFSSYELFKGNRALSSVSFSGGWGGGQGFIGGVNARQMFSVGNGRLFLGVQGEYKFTNRASRDFTGGAVGRYYIFNTKRWSAFGQGGLNFGYLDFNLDRYYGRLGVVPFGGGLGGPLPPTSFKQNYFNADLGLGLQYRVTKRLAVEMLFNKPFILGSKSNTSLSPNWSWVSPLHQRQTTQIKLGINVFFGK
jgi:hypothetical protein